MVLKTPVLTTHNEDKYKKKRSASKLEKGVFLGHWGQTGSRLYVGRCCLIVGSNVNRITPLVVRLAIQTITHFPYPGVGVSAL